MIGRTVGRFRILSELGRGGMASVWKAEDPLLGRNVAVKILAEELATSAVARSRFLHEARASALIDHPGVPTIYDAGESDGLVYMALSLIDGETLSALAARSPMAIDQAVGIIVGAAHTLEHAHARGVIHRDVTGRNIMRARDGRVFVLDFGLALAAGDSRITSANTLLGTLPYLAPEVLEGKTADHRSDVYGLGVVLYELLTGRLPFTGERREALFYAATHSKVLSPRVHRPEISASLEKVVLCALARNAGDRFQSALDLASALASCQSSERGLVEPSLPPPAPEAPPAVPWAPRGAIYLAVLPFEAMGSRGTPDPEWELVARGLAESLGAALGRDPGVYVTSPYQARDLSGETDDQKIARQLGVNLILRGSVRRSRGAVRTSYAVIDPWRRVQIAGSTVRGREDGIFELEDGLAESVRKALGLEVAPGRPRPRRGDPAAREHYLQALGYLQRSDNEASLDGAIDLLERLLVSEGDSAPVLAALGRACLEKYRQTWNRTWESRAASVCQRALELDPAAPEVLVTLGHLHLAGGRHENAIREFRRALEIRADQVEALLGLGRALEACGRIEEAEEVARQTVAVRATDWRVFSRLGVLYFNQGRYAQATAPFRRVIQLTPDNVRGHNNLGSTLYHLDRFEESLAAYRRSIEIQPTHLALMNLGTVLYYLHRFEESAQAFERAVGLSPADARLWGNLGSACRWIPGAQERAAEALERAIALIRERLERNPQEASSWTWLSAWLANRGRLSESRDAIKRALELAPHDVQCMAMAGRVYFVLGERNQALHWFGEAVGRGYGVEKLRRDPELAPLRQDPSFLRILNEGSARHGTLSEEKPNLGGAA